MFTINAVNWLIVKSMCFLQTLRIRQPNQTEIEREREYSRQQGEKLAELSEKLVELTRNGQILAMSRIKICLKKYDV